MTDITLCQKPLEPSGFVVNPDKLATDLYECSLIIFFVLIRHPSAEPAFLQRIRTQLQRFQLWGGDFDAREGGLDDRIVNSDRLKDVLLPVLGRMADVLVKIVHRRSQDKELEEVTSRLRLLNEKVLWTDVRTGSDGEDPEPDILQFASILDEIISSGSEVSTIDESSEIDELLQDVKSSNDCLFELGSVLQDSAESIVPSSGDVYGSKAVNLTLLNNTAWPYISNIIEAYPSIDRDLARRLGEANERRYNRLQTRRDEAVAETQGSESDCSGEELVPRPSSVQDSRPPSTGFAQSECTAPSTQLSSVFDALVLSAPDPTRGKAPKPALSTTTFASTLDESDGQKRSRRLPKMPDEQPWGTPFNCTVCGDKLYNVWSSAEWVKHIYRDLQPYICTFPACSSENKTFISRHEWSAHELAKHRKHIAWACGQCEPGAGVFQNEGQLRSHFPRQHPALSPQQLTSVVRSTSESVAIRITRERCPFCLTCPASTPAQLISHIGRHLQEVAHAAIPMSLLSEDTGSLEGLDDSGDEIQGGSVSEEPSSMAGSQNPTASDGNDEADPKLQSSSNVTMLQTIGSVRQVVKSLNDTCECYNSFALDITLVISHLSNIQAALEALYAWRVSENSGGEATKQLDENLDLTLRCCAILVHVIESKLIESGYIPGMGTKQDIRYTWLQGVLKEYVSNLEGQVRALQLLLSICQRESAMEQNQQLANLASREIIENVRTETMGMDDAMTILSQDPSVHLDVDPVLLKSSPYIRIRNEIQVEEHAGRPSKIDGPLSAPATIVAIAELLERLVRYRNDTYKSNRQRLAFSGCVEELFLKVQVLKEDSIFNESGPRYADLPVSSKIGRQTEHKNDFDMLETLRSSIEDMMNELRPRHGFRANARQLFNFKGEKHFQKTIRKVMGWTDVVDSILKHDHFPAETRRNDRMSVPKFKQSL